MSDSRYAQKVAGLLIALIFLAPFLIVALQIDDWLLPDLAEVVSVMSFTFLQAFLSAAFSLIIGVAAAGGVMWLDRAAGSKTSSKVSRAAEAFVLLPNAAPVILLLLAVMKFFPWLTGLKGIVAVHTLLNSGLVAISFLSLTRHKLTGMAELAWVEGSSRKLFLVRGAIPLLKKDLSLLFLFVFAICFSSFAVPLIIGGSRATTIEVLIYQKIRLAPNWSEALGLAALQMTTLLAMAWFLRRGQEAGVALRSSPIALLSWKWGLLFAFLPGFILIAGMIEGLAEGIKQISKLTSLVNELPELIAGSFVLATLTSSFVIFTLLLFAWIDPRGSMRKFFTGYAAPSSVLTGIALLIAWRTLGWATYVKIALGLTLVMVPAFYRLRWDSLLRSLRDQRSIARTLGAGEKLIFTRIVFPQVIGPAFFFAGLASLWAWGDFALSSVVAERALTVAMVTEGLMGSYRLEAATILSWVLILGGIVSFLLLMGVGRVLGEEPRA